MTDANWCVRMGNSILVLAMVFAAVSCGGGGTDSTSLDPTQNAINERGGSSERSVGVLVTEGEIASLPAWQQEMLSDPGWNQPFIAPAAGTAIEAPSDELLRDELQKAMEKGRSYSYRGLPESGKGVSWNDQGGFDGVTNVAKGEYQTLAPGGTPSYGCNNSGANSANGHAVEDVIVNTNMVIPQRISYVLEGISEANYFNKLGGSSKSNLAAVYQLFATDRSEDPQDPDSTAEFAELSYRSDLAPGVGVGGDCSAAEAFAVSGEIWNRFNSVLENALPSLNTTEVFNILIAPSGEVSDAEVSSKSTTGRWQPFYFGDVSACFGGGAIVTLTSSESSCSDFTDYFDGPTGQEFFTNPVYGVLLSRWTQAQLAGMGGPWESEFGWPVFGPTIYGNGSQYLSVAGTYYAFGMWFEGGFVWWIDYDQNLYPNASDEAQAYRYTGSHVYCGDGVYEQIGTPILYGGAGDLGVSVVVDSYRNSGADPWTPVALSDDGTHYQVTLPSEDGLATVNIAAHAHGFGGNPNEDCLYKYYVWAWRDGSITAAGSAYSTDQQYRTHTYGSLARNLENIYVIRVQITDASLDLSITSEEIRAYGDALPLHLGHGAAGGGGEILVVRHDGGNYNTNFDALIADLDSIGAAYQVRDYSATIDTEFQSEAFKVAIWYRGGPGDNAETALYNTSWGGAELDLMNIVNNGGTGAGVLNLSQNHGINNPFNSPGFLNSWWENTQGWTCLNAGPLPTTFSAQEGQPEGFYYPYFPLLANSTNVKANGTHAGGEFNTYSVNSAERNDANGGSGKVPITFTFDPNRQCTVQASALNIPGISPTFTGGIAYPGTFGIGQLSYGNSAAPGTSGGGPGRYYSFGQSWSGVNVSLSNAGGPGAMTRADLLQNMLAWLDSTLTFGAGGGAEFGEYVGPPEIVQVTPISWAGIGGDITPGASSLTGVHYPDPSGTDVYRGGANAANENFIRRSAGPNETGLNGNDVDFQFPRYAFIHDGDDSLALGGGVTGDEMLINYGGLLVNQGLHSGFNGGAGTQWNRVDNTAGGYIDWDTNSDLTGAPDADGDAADGSDFADGANVLLSPVAGYWTTTDEIIDTNADNSDDVADSKVMASYGAQPAHLTFASVDEPITFEAIAHWDHDDPNISNQLFWALYPGHTAYNPGTFQLYGEDISWQNWVLESDIDPSHPNPGGLSYDRNDWRWMQNGFTYSELLAEGRVVNEFDFTQVDGWNGDLDKDGNLGETPDDKYPVRTRLLINTGAYDDWWNNFGASPGPNPYPNHWPDASTFIEGGCYVVDNSAAGFGGPPVIIAEETPTGISAGWTIVWTGTYPAAPSWDITATYTIDVGAAPGTIISFDLNADLPVDGSNFDEDVVIGGTFNPGTHTQTFSVTDGDISGGWSNGDLNILGIRGVNGSGPGYASYTIPIWFGDVVAFDDFETDPNIFVGQTLPPDRNLHQNEYWTWDSPYSIPTGTHARWDAVGTRAHYTYHSNMEGNAIFIDNGGTTYWNGGGVFTPAFAILQPPCVIVPSNDDIHIHVRSAGITESSFDYMTVSSPIWNTGPPWDGGNNFGLIFAFGVHGPNPNAVVRSGNISQMYNSVGWQWKSNTNQFAGSYMLYADGSVAPNPGGVVFDNMLSTHASTFPPYL